MKKEILDQLNQLNGFNVVCDQPQDDLIVLNHPPGPFSFTLRLKTVRDKTASIKEHVLSVIEYGHVRRTLRVY
jgi:hypothetical protein